MAVFSVLLLLAIFPFTGVRTCGVSTHIAIAHEALNSFSDENTKYFYRNLLLKHQDAFLGGNPYPDIMYPSLCFEGKYHQVSEDTHWSPFLNATINYIRRKYPKPWDEATEKLVVFTLGFVSHQVADISWHSLGIDQGFLTTMGDQNFFGSFPAAHSVGDIGGDIVADFEGDETNFKILQEWYIPVQDLVNIYSDYYGKEMVNSMVLTTCSQLLYLAWIAEKLAGRELFSYYAKKSPFLVENFHDYFLGGVHDMAAWSSEIWADTVYMLENGMDNCNMPRPPLFITCNKTQDFNHKMKKWDKVKNPGLWYPVLLNGLTSLDTVVKETPRGIYIRPSADLENILIESKRKESILNQKKEKLKNSGKITEEKIGMDINRVVYSTNTPYARLGWSTASGNFSGLRKDLIIGAPNHGYPGNSQFGRVYVIHVNPETGLPLKNLTLDTDSDQMIDGIVQNGRFGTSLAVVDFNKDGIEDLAVSAPAVGASNLEYTGAVYIFFGKYGVGLTNIPNVTIFGKNTYDNIGIILASEDLNQDGFMDLTIGCPYASGGGGEQRGMVGIFLSNLKYKSVDSVSIMKADWLLFGKQNYSWFGSSLSVESVKGEMAWLAVSAPTFRLCGVKSCIYCENDTQSVGQITMYRLHPTKGPLLIAAFTGQDVFAKFGTRSSLGDPFNTGVKSVLAVSSCSADIDGIVDHFPVTFHQGGSVHLYNISTILQSSWHKNMKGLQDKSFAVFEGDRSYSRFGSQLDWLDINMDGIDDLIVSSPYRTDQLGAVTGAVEQGSVYVFFGGESFPSGDVTRNCNSGITPCPGEKASLVFSPDQDESQFGSQFIAVKRHSDKMINFVVSSPRSSQGGSYHGGAVYVYNLKNLFGENVLL